MARKFERLLFDGIPEQPETVYERDDNGIIAWRLSGRSLASEEHISEGISIGTYRYDLETGEVVYIPNPGAMELLNKEIDSK
jgi:hypothetical protein